MTILNKVSNKSLMTGVTPIADVPDAPTIGTATNVGTAQAYNNGSATVAYTAASTGGAATTFTATSTPGSFTATGSSPITVTGLQSATAYTFTVSPSNASATGPASSASSSVTATTVPQAPTIGTVTDGGTGTTVSVPFTAGATGGSAITSYSIVSSPATTTQTTSSSPYTFTGLTAGTAYTFTVTATNANGTSTASSASNSVTPVVPSNFFLISQTTLGSPAASFTFSSIPSAYKSLQLRMILRDSSAGTSANYISLRFNGDTGSTYASHQLYDNYGSVAAYGAASQTFIQVQGGNISGNATANTFAASITDIVDYASTSKYKTSKSFAGGNTNNGSGYNDVGFNSGLWQSTAAINSITVYVGSPNGYNINTGSTLSLYGVS